MFQTFTGSSRRPRNVNLSGRTSNPFATVQQSSRPGQGSSPNAVAQAQQERRARQAEREKIQAARTVQRVWRGHSTRVTVGNELRNQWDQGTDPMNIEDGDSGLDWELQRLKILVRFPNRRNDDLRRICHFARWLQNTVNSQGSEILGSEWTTPLTKLVGWTVNIMERQRKDLDEDTALNLLRLQTTVASFLPGSVSRIGYKYYSASGAWIVDGKFDACHYPELIDWIVRPLDDPSVYDCFIIGLLTKSNLNEYIDLSRLSQRLDLNILSQVARRVVSDSLTLIQVPKRDLMWTLAYFIFLHHPSSVNKGRLNLNINFTATVCSLLSWLSDLLSQRPNIHNTLPEADIPSFVQEQVQTLMNQDSIQNLLAASQLLPSESTSIVESEDAAVLASYALTLLQVFPRKGDDIRMWLYMGSMSKRDSKIHEPAIKFFWKAVKRTTIYQEIYEEPTQAIRCLKSSRRASFKAGGDSIDSDWRKILLFLELYSVVLKVMDDEEFMTGAESSGLGRSWTRQSALPISDVIHLTIFLKHFAFAMYWYHSQIMDQDEPVDSTRIASYFGNVTDTSPKLKEVLKKAPKSEDKNSFAGISGMDLDYMKGMVTGLLRMLYERDSRRNFTRDKDHWLMKELHMEGFISDVVEEQAVQSQHREDDSEDTLTDEDGSEEDLPQTNLVGTARTQQVRRLERLRRHQKRDSKRRHIETVTPRLVILQNMPFFIPFATRVEIFREFVQNDQYTRRDGYIDPDQWRMAHQNRLTQSRGQNRDLAKHSAKVRRDHVFEDAYVQFYELGEGLKEPIQITFVDQFDAVEAGIDGGGVTKEFLTSVTSEAFSTDQDFKMFIENDQHLLYPNPSAIDEMKEMMRNFEIADEGSADWNSKLQELKKQYEFLGRIVGKCLYEGILVDIHFAPFFLVKWALTGGYGSATNESGYRANINDLRDLDEELYQGLLKLKNYPGNVEDFSLDFTVTDVVSSGPPPKFATRELRWGGASMTVTNKNRLVYISDVARHRLKTQPAVQTEAFLRGLCSIVQPSWLSMFNQSELQTLLGGDASEIDVEDLRRNTWYGGVYAIGDDGQEHPTVKDFWSVMKDLNDTDRRKVLKYVTSTPRGPLLGFGQLNPKFSIRDSGADQTRLPSTSTCVNLLKLPIYKDRGLLKEKLLYAVNAGAGFNLS